MYNPMEITNDFTIYNWYFGPELSGKLYNSSLSHMLHVWYIYLHLP